MSRPLTSTQLASLHAPLATICAVATSQVMWSRGAIEGYKLEELVKAPPPSWLYPYRDAIAVLLDYTFMGLGLCFGCACPVLLVSALIFVIGFGEVFGSIAFWTSIVWGGSLAGLAGLVSLDFMTLRGPAVWRSYSLSDFQRFVGKIPQPAQEGLAQIRAAVPVTVVVHALIQDLFLLDPILEVSHINPATGEEETAYPFVWDKDGNIINAR